MYRPGDYDPYLPADAVQLVVEVTSSGNRSNDSVVKFERYIRAGIPHYWIVDPDVITVYELVDGAYRVTTEGAAVRVQRPFAVEVAVA